MAIVRYENQIFLLLLYVVIFISIVKGTFITIITY